MVKKEFVLYCDECGKRFVMTLSTKAHQAEELRNMVVSGIYLCCGWRCDETGDLCLECADNARAKEGKPRNTVPADTRETTRGDGDAADNT